MKKPKRKRARRSLKALRNVEWPEGSLRTSERLQVKRQGALALVPLSLSLSLSVRRDVER